MGALIQTSVFSQKIKKKVQCTLCPHNCLLHEGKIGICGVRRNIGGKIRTRNYGFVSALAVDPVEKKPLYHFYPGRNVLSVGSWGCNLKCNFCQNWKISQTCNDDEIISDFKTPDELVNIAKETPNNIGIAYTYNEPTVWYEFMFEIAIKAHRHGLKNIMVSNGYINHEPLVQLIPYIDAFNIDIKGFTEDFYRDMSQGKLLVVLDTIKTIKEHNKHIEITNLLIPGKNDNLDDFRKMVSWIANEIGSDTVLHLSRYFPRYKQSISATSSQLLEKLRDVALEKLKYVYLGNIDTTNDTYCPQCNNLSSR